MVTLATVMLIFLQHNAAHLGIVTGLCLSEASTIYMKPVISKLILSTAVIAAISTALAEILGASIALNMLFNIPIKLGAGISALFVIYMLFTNSYKKLEKWIMGFVSIIGISFLFELSFIDIEWKNACNSWFIVEIPNGAIPVIMSILGAVVMPHNLFLHSEVIQSRRWDLKDKKIIEKQLKYEFLDTLFSMIVGWGINSAIIIIASETFFKFKLPVDSLEQAHLMLKPLLGNMASYIFALALLFSGLSSCITAGMAGGTIFAGIWGEPYNIKDKHSKIGVFITILGALFAIFFIKNLFKGLIYSQILLSIQLPITIFLQIYLTSSKKVMKEYVNSKSDKIILWIIGIIVATLNIMLVGSNFFL